MCYGSSYYDISRSGIEAENSSLGDLPEFIDPAYETHFNQFTQDRIKINELLESNRLTAQIEDRRMRKNMRNYGVVAASTGERSPNPHQGYNSMTIGQKSQSLPSSKITKMSLKYDLQDFERKKYIENYYNKLQQMCYIDKNEQQLVEKLLHHDRVVQK